MNIGILNGNDGFGKKFMELCDSIKLKENITEADFLNNGFTNYHEPTLYFNRRLNMKNNYPISFNISISKKDLTIKNIDILDENFLQPCFVDKDIYEQAKGWFEKLSDRGLLQISIK
jgi:hypothetical protein